MEESEIAPYIVRAVSKGVLSMVHVPLITTNKENISKCHFFRIAYTNGKEKWVAFDAPNASDLAVREMKTLIEESETNRMSGQLSTVWYMGKLALWKI